ncbi:MAG: hypothetical protein WCD08_03350, partial [Steroidobacteraceae bacterium]
MRSTTGLGVRRLGVTALLLSLSAFSATAWADIRLTPSSVSVSVGATAISTVSGTRDPLTVRSANSGIATASIAGNVISVRGVAAGSSIVVVLHGGERVATLGVTVTRATTLRVTPTSLSISVGSRATAGVSGAAGSVSVRSLNTAIASASISGTTISVLGVAPG